jgi:glyoxylase-like metal-dependent hydrolase (beta-lactamase superfamily II)
VHFVALAGLVFAAVLQPAAEAPARVFRFDEVRPGIFHAVGTGKIATGCNAAVIVNAEDVLVVDSHISPAAGAALVEELRAITDKPVRYVVNTHFHFDHVHGNQVFGPGVEIVGHEFTRERVLAGATRSGRAWQSFIGGIPATVAGMKAQLAEASEAERSHLEQRIAGAEALQAADAEVVPVAPGLTLRRRLTLHRGEREIQLLFFGRGHTGGDVVVYLPREKLLATGDLITAGLPYMGDGYLLEWAETLAAVEQLDFEVILPGHGEAFEDRDRVSHLAAYLRELWEKAASLHAEGVPAAEAAARIDMTAHAAHFPQIEHPGVHPHAVERVYELLEAGEGR